MNEPIEELLQVQLSDSTILFKEPMSRHTSFKTGGPADIVILVRTVRDLKNTILLANMYKTPYYIIGNGTNLLVSDDGIRGIVILTEKLEEQFEIEEHEDSAIVRASAGMPIIKVAMEVSRRGYKGLQFASGIPGSVGGAVFMNAGAYGGEIRDCLRSVTVMDKDANIFETDAAELDLSYRHSNIEEKQLIVLSAVFELVSDSADALMEEVASLNKSRREKQPLEYPSAGSTFKRPEGYFAGKLIQDAGLRGFSVGGACVSEKHCGFVINKDNATSTEIYRLICEVCDRVYENSGVRLEPEVRMLGFRKIKE